MLFVFPETKVFRKIFQSGRASAFFLVIFGKLLRACFIVLAPAKLKIVGVLSVRNDVSVPFSDCPSNRRHSEYYLCQTVKLDQTFHWYFNISKSSEYHRSKFIRTTIPIQRITTKISCQARFHHSISFA